MCEIKYLNDIVIKKALAKDNPIIRNYIARLISDTTNIPYELLENNLELLYPEVSANKSLVNSEVDLVYKNQNIYFNIEINYGKSRSQRNKNFTYTLQLALRDIKNAKEYKNMHQVYQININAFDPYGYGELVYETLMMEKKYHIIYNNQIKIYDINLEYFKKIPYNEIERERLLKDLAIFVVEEESVLSNLYEGDKGMEETKKEMDNFLKEIDSILFYDPEDLQRQIEEEMMEKGLEKGEKKSRIEIAKELLALQIDVETISKATKLSIEEVEKLKEE